MPVTFAEKLARIPHYEPGTSLDDAQARAETADAVKLASNESPFPPHPAVVEAIAAAATDANRYPDPTARLLRRRLADRFDSDPARIAVSNGSCEILLAAALALCEEGDEILYAWPSFSMYPHLPALSGAREIQVPLTDRYVHDLDAMLDEVTVFSIVIAGLAVAAAAVPAELAALATVYVLLMAVLGPIAARVVEPVARWVRRIAPTPAPSPGS